MKNRKYAIYISQNSKMPKYILFPHSTDGYELPMATNSKERIKMLIDLNGLTCTKIKRHGKDSYQMTYERFS